MQKPEGNKEVNHAVFQARVFQSEGTARAEAQGQGHT